MLNTKSSLLVPRSFKKSNMTKALCVYGSIVNRPDSLLLLLVKLNWTGSLWIIHYLKTMLRKPYFSIINIVVSSLIGYGHWVSDQLPSYISIACCDVWLSVTDLPVTIPGDDRSGIKVASMKLKQLWWYCIVQIILCRHYLQF